MMACVRMGCARTQASHVLSPAAPPAVLPACHVLAFPSSSPSPSLPPAQSPSLWFRVHLPPYARRCDCLRLFTGPSCAEVVPDVRKVCADLSILYQGGCRTDLPCFNDCNGMGKCEGGVCRCTPGRNRRDRARQGRGEWPLRRTGPVSPGLRRGLLSAFGLQKMPTATGVLARRQS
jgi:hypothetical protein